MPLKTIDLTTPPGFIIQVCAGCAGEHRINLDRGAVETKPGPFALTPGDTLELKVDGAAPATVTFASGDFPDFAAVSAAQLATKLAAGLATVQTSVEPGGPTDSVVIESKTTGPTSALEAVGGTARTALGFPTDGRVDPSGGRPVLGVSVGGVKNKNLISLRRCNCGSNELLVRTWDVAPPGLGGLSFYEQRKAVNALAQHFKSQGWVHPDVLGEVSAETTEPPDKATGLPGVVLMPPLPLAPAAGGTGAGP